MPPNILPNSQFFAESHGNTTNLSYRTIH